MPFDVGLAAAKKYRVILSFNGEKLSLYYNAGEKFKEYQKKAQAADMELLELQARTEVIAAQDASSDEAQEARDEALSEMKKRMARARRDLADGICMVIEEWDLVGDRGYIRSLMSKEDQKSVEHLDGQGEIPIEGVWLDALPLPDQFVQAITRHINQDFEGRGAGSKKG
jgi:hypothetical protein